MQSQGPDDGDNSELSEENIGGDFLRSALSVNYIYDSRDSSIQPRSGHKVDLGLTYAGLGGDVDTFTLSAQGQKYWNLKWDSIFSVNGELAFVDSVGDDESRSSSACSSAAAARCAVSNSAMSDRVIPATRTKCMAAIRSAM